MNTWNRRLSFKGFSIKRRLPLLICVLLLSVMTTFILISYFSVRRVVLKSGHERVNALAEQLSNMLMQSTQQMTAYTRVPAVQDSLRNFIVQPASSDESSVKRVLARLRVDTTVVMVELLDAKGQPVIQFAPDSIQKRFDFEKIRREVLLNETASVGKIHAIGDSMFYPVTAPLTYQNKTVGTLFVWRKMNVPQRQIDQVANLMGTDANFYIANRDHSLWTNLRIKIDDPLPKDTTHNENVINYQRNQKNMFGAIRPVPNTAWITLVEFPRNKVVETAHQFLKWLIGIGTLLLLIGIFIAWRISRNITYPLKTLTEAVSSIASGEYKAQVPIDRRDELGKLARAFNAMTAKVSRAKTDLERQVMETAHRNDQLRELSAHLQNIREEERIHIAREMHDELGQLLTGFKMDVSWLHKKLGETTDPAIREKLEEMMGVVNEAAKFVRKLASELRPSILDDLGLIAAIDWHSQEFKRRSNIDVEFHTEINELHTNEIIATGLFRMYQESLTNVARHAEATKVITNLSVKGGEIYLSITDNGKGFDLAGTGQRKTLGLLGMRERAAMIGGKLEIQSKPGRGTTVLITVPFQENRVLQSDSQNIPRLT